jgi:hypothetical protein
VDRTIRAGDGIVCRVNGTVEHYTIGTVVSGKAGALLLRAVSTMVGQHSAVRHAYQQRTHDSRVWLFGGAAAAYLEAAAPAGHEFCGDTLSQVSADHTRAQSQSNDSRCDL